MNPVLPTAYKIRFGKILSKGERDAEAKLPLEEINRYKTANLTGMITYDPQYSIIQRIDKEKANLYISIVSEFKNHLKLLRADYEEKLPSLDSLKLSIPEAEVTIQVYRDGPKQIQVGDITCKQTFLYRTCYTLISYPKDSSSFDEIITTFSVVWVYNTTMNLIGIYDIKVIIDDPNKVPKFYRIVGDSIASDEIITDEQFNKFIRKQRRMRRRIYRYVLHRIENILTITDN